MFTGGGAASTLERRGDLDISTTGLIEGTKVALTLIGHLESTAANAERDATESVLRVNGIDGKCDADVICDSFDYVTSSYVTFMSFKRFLLHEQSLENLHFWLDVEVYRGLDEKERWTRARELNERFVRPGAMYEVNVSSQHKQKVAKVLKQQGEEGDVPVDLFDKAQTEVLNVMRRDSYSRFKKSELYIANQTLLTMLMSKGEGSSTFYVPCGYTSTAKCVCGVTASSCPMPPRQVWPLHSLVHSTTAVGITQGINDAQFKHLGVE